MNRVLNIGNMTNKNKLQYLHISWQEIYKVYCKKYVNYW